jgi:hypothetical protein
MNESTPTSRSNTSPRAEGSAATAPALAYTNPQPRLPHSEASPPEQPETFIRRARRIRLGSHRLKTGFLSLCTFGRAWTRGEDVLEIGIKQSTLAGELECKRDTLIELLRDLKAIGHVHVFRKKYHSLIRIFLTPQMQGAAPKSGATRQSRDAPKNGATGNRDAPKNGAADAPNFGATKVFRSVLDVQQQQQEQQQPARSRADLEPDPLNQPPAGREPTERQLSGIASMAAELRIPTPDPVDRLAADAVFRELKERVNAHRASPSREPTVKQLSGIISMAAELGIPAPQPEDRLTADAVFQDLREQVEAQRAKRRPKGKSYGPERPHVIEYSRIDRQSRCRVCGAWNPNPRGECAGA